MILKTARILLLFISINTAFGKEVLEFHYKPDIHRYCPETTHHVIREGACIVRCPEWMDARDGDCRPCRGKCITVCRFSVNPPLIHSKNIETFRHCQILHGSLAFLSDTFNGHRYPPLDLNSLKIFHSLQDISGYLHVEAFYSNFTSLEFLKNLRIIRGQEKHKQDQFGNGPWSFVVYRSSLESLKLRNLKEIRGSGAILIKENPTLCFVNQLNWNKLRGDYIRPIISISNNLNRQFCEQSGNICSGTCEEMDGCWGPLSSDCFTCKNFKLVGNDECVGSCGQSNQMELCAPRKPDGLTGNAQFKGKCPDGYYNDLGAASNITGDTWMEPESTGVTVDVCLKCHNLCGECTGFGVAQSVCKKCKNFRKGYECVEECVGGHSRRGEGTELVCEMGPSMAIESVNDDDDSDKTQTAIIIASSCLCVVALAFFLIFLGFYIKWDKKRKLERNSEGTSAREPDIYKPLNPPTITTEL